MPLDAFRDLVESVGGRVIAERTHVAKPNEWPRQRLWPCVRVEMPVGRSDRFRAVAAPTFRACCDALLPWVQEQARRMETA